MSSFDNKSLKKVTLKSTSTHKCSTSNSVKKIVLIFHQFRMTPPLIILAVPNMKNMNHQLIISGKIMQANMGNNF